MSALNMIQEPEPPTARSCRKADVSQGSHAPARERLSVPRRGQVLTTVAEVYGQPVRKAASILVRAFSRLSHDSIRGTYLTRRLPEPGSPVARSQSELLGWSLASIWLTGYAVGAFPRMAGLKDAECWFLGNAASGLLSDFLSDRAIKTAEKALLDCADPQDCLELLPYVLDPHGPGSRLSIRRDESTRVSRDRKRAEGVYYTPADVAEFMVRQCLQHLAYDQPPALLDPACGTAVFLRAGLWELRQRWPEFSALSLAQTCLYGVDIDPWTLDAAAFVLLADCLADGDAAELPPACRWHQLRLNLACVDTLRLDPPANFPSQENLAADHVCDALAAGRLPSVQQFSEPFDGRLSVYRVFPGLPAERLVVCGNPPYADLGHREDLSRLATVFTTLGGKPRRSTELYLLFIEQMIRLLSEGQGAGTFVLPLSLACNVSDQFSQTRALIQKTPGAWRFAFFDREPHALFGEDVKTRNAILIWAPNNGTESSTLAAGPLRKWRADRRAEMFSSIDYTPITCDIRAGIPKIDGRCQAQAFAVLSARWERLEHAFSGIRRVPLAHVFDADERTVFVGPTAYNFLNVFPKPSPGVLPLGARLSEHPLHAVTFPTKSDSMAAFAVLSSHLAYWWWHVTADGFHVNGRFIASLPFGLDALSGATAGKLVRLGAQLWSIVQLDPIVSLNRGRTSLAFSPNGFDGIRRQIDEVLADLASLEGSFVDELQQFTTHAIRAELRAAKDNSSKEGA